MYESISKGHLMGIIAVLLILVIVLSLRLRGVPEILPDVVAFHKTLAEKTSAAAAIIDINGKITPFGRDLSLLKLCGENKDTTFPASCRPTEGSNLLFQNGVTVSVYGKENNDPTDLIVSAGDPVHSRGNYCPGGQCCC